MLAFLRRAQWQKYFDCLHLGEGAISHCLAPYLQAQKTAAKQNVLVYRTLLSEEMLAQGLSNVGDSRRMERFVQKLLNGELHRRLCLCFSVQRILLLMRNRVVNVLPVCLLY